MWIERITLGNRNGQALWMDPCFGITLLALQDGVSKSPKNKRVVIYEFKLSTLDGAKPSKIDFEIKRHLWLDFYIPIDGRVRDVMIDELSPLHHHEGISDVGGADVVVNVDRDQAGTGQRRARHRSAAWTHQAVVVGRRQQPGEGTDGLAVFRKQQVVAPTGQGTVLGGVVARQGLLVASKH